ncbi:nicotinate-nucleotide--dimethylbenzimidazole phosphoribosyltransferase [Streptomyces sp. NPDC000349]|uniref:nicotinate-nucleotide--dimethylbenzimidazole phosphoribosyltransferase n=1 Tax=unclassified Streptomyces TaxID=2593676 RepID=UPI002786D7F5|nr:nicotinate-nucleotide--dimethylbenzimidazole phosphoribosyltransferase [Streptomyces sp. DSM 40167]MDQ0402746.1 nicotinate-nucleotide--dimethylbenzimidazole phosphoribosyltransferase [Streptomyces sp. DSM 40167]
MTDTGQIPGEGLPENAGMVEQPGVPAPGAYTYLSEAEAEDEDLLLLPGAQGAWGNEVAPPAPEPVVETVHQPGPHELSGRDSGSVDLNGVRLPDPAQDPATAPAPPRRPLHLGPPIPDTSASPVRSLADRGPADAPVRHSGPPAAGPEYLDGQQAAATPPQAAAPWGAQNEPQTAPAPVSAAAGHAETVIPVPEQASEPVGAAQALVTRVATEAVAATGGTGTPEPESGEDSAPVAHVPGPAEEPAPEPVVAEPTPEPVATEPTPEPVAMEFTPEPVATNPMALAGDEGQEAQAAEGAEGADAVSEPSAPEEPAAWEEPRPAEAPAPQEAPSAEAPALQDAPVPEMPALQDAPVLEMPAPQDAPVPEMPAPPVPAAEPAPEVTEPEPAPAPEALVATEPPAPAQQEEVPQPEPQAPPVPQDPAPAQPEVEFAAQPPAEPAPEAHPTAEETPDVPQEDVPQDAAVFPAPPEPAATDATPVAATAEQPRPEQAPVAQEPQPDDSVGRFLPVDGAPVPTTPHLAPTPPEALVLPPEGLAAEPGTEDPATDPAPEIPAPREADPGLAQSADDLDTHAADQDDLVDAAAPAPEQTVSQDVRRSAGPAAPAYDDAEREAVLKVMRERRDIRNGFRGDPIPHEVLLRVLEAAHTAPSVGHSQPWDFVVIRSADTRRAMHELAMRQREAYAKSLPKGRAKQFKELKIEAILDTPVNIVVTADPTRGGRHTLGRHTQPQMAPYSSALAVENLWLAARAEGLGVGWVSFFDEREMVRALGLPEHLDVVAYLCVGYVDEFPDEPELMQAGWSKRRPLSWVVHEETYGRRALPGEAPHDLLAETVAQIRPLDAKALGEAWERQKRMTKPAGALGMLEIISAQLSGLSRQCPPPIPEPAAVAVFAGDHGVHAQGVTPWPQEVTAQMVANFLGGGAVCNAFATQVGAEVCVVDVGVATDLPATPGLLPRKVRAGTSDMTTGPAMTREEAKQAVEVGIETARDLVAAGNKALLTGEMGIANTTASAALISVFTGADPAEVTGRGTGINDETLARKTEVVRRALELHQPDPADPLGVLAAIGGFEHAAIVGLLLGGASLRTPVILDGVSAGAAALVARAIAPEVLAACIAGHRSAEPGHVAALNKLGLRPLVDLDLRLGEGTGALLALPMVQSTARAMHEVATFDSAGVTEK